MDQDTTGKRTKEEANALTEPRCVGRFSDYEGFLAVLRVRATELQVAVSGDQTAEVSGLPDRYLQKLIGAKPVRRIGMTSLGSVLGILGAELWLVEDPEAMKRFVSRVKKRDERLVRAAKIHFTVTSRFMKKIAVAGGRKRMASLSRWQRRRLARKAAAARWPSKPTAGIEKQDR